MTTCTLLHPIASAFQMVIHPVSQLRLFPFVGDRPSPPTPLVYAPPLDFVIYHATVRPSACVHYLDNQYSVPAQFIGQPVTLYITPKQIDIYWGDRCIAQVNQHHIS